MLRFKKLTSVVAASFLNIFVERLLKLRKLILQGVAPFLAALPERLA